MSTQDLLSELRSITQRTPSRESWDELTELLEGMTGDQLEVFETRIAPYLDGALERWPDELRVVDDLEHGPPVMRIARTLLVEDTYTQALMKSRAQLWASPACAGITQVRVHIFDKYLERLFDTLMRSLSGLTSVFVEGDFADTPKPSLAAKNLPVSASDFVNLAVDLHGPTLESFGLQSTWEDDDRVDARLDLMWATFFERLDDLPQLRALHVRQDHQVKQVVKAILSEPRLDRLEELHIVSESMPLNTSWLVEREASKNLRCVRISSISHAKSLELVQAPNLSGVTCWELHEDTNPDTYRHDWSGSEASRYWASRSPFMEEQAHDPAAKRWLGLYEYDARKARDLLFDKEDNLRHNEHVEGLGLCDIEYGDLRRLFAQAHEAMPDLRTLVLLMPHTFRPQDVRALSNAPLIEQLSAFYCKPTRAIDKHDWWPSSKKEALVTAQTWFEVAHDTSIHPALRLHAWRCGTLRFTLEDLRRIAKVLGIRGFSKASKEDLEARVAAFAPDVAQDPRAAILDAAIPKELDRWGQIAQERAQPT